MSASRRRVTLSVTAQDPTTEIFLVDGRFGKVAEGLGQIEYRVLPGLYKVKFKAGSLIKEVDAFVEGDSERVVVEAPHMAFSTPAPIEGTRHTREYHRDASDRLSRTVHVRAGTGSQIFVFVRDVDRRGRTNPTRGLSLHTLGGDRIAAYELDGESDIDARYDPWAGCNVELDPGPYRLRVRTGEVGTLEQVVYASAGWQTQIFLLRRAYGHGSAGRRPNISEASVLMARLGSGFIPGRDDLRWTEQARLGLASRRSVLAERDVQTMLFSKWENPMLGIYGAHLLLLEMTRSKELLLAEVVHNLQGMLGEGHPDVEALKLRVPALARRSLLEVPPMLRSSWEIVLDVRKEMPDRVLKNTFADAVSGQLWGTGVWLTWRMPVRKLKGLEVWFGPAEVPAFTDIKTSIDAVFATVQAEQPDLPPKAVAPDGTVTLLFTDIEGSTPLNERLGDQRWMELLRAHNALVREELRSYDGFEVKTEGDGFMVAFGSARKALQCAIAVQRSFAKHNETADEPVGIRIGLHTGEAVWETGDFYGKHVNLASRIADQARGSEILVSSVLKELTESAGDVDFGEGREVELKGLSGSQRVYNVGWE